jgi:hypothetical protein
VSVSFKTGSPYAAQAGLEWISCLHLLGTGIIGEYHHASLCMYLFVVEQRNHGRLRGRVWGEGTRFRLSLETLMLYMPLGTAWTVLQAEPDQPPSFIVPLH